MDSTSVENTKETKRLNFDVPLDLHKKIKSIVVERNISIRTWIVRLIINELIRLDKLK